MVISDTETHFTTIKLIDNDCEDISEYLQTLFYEN